MGHFELWWKIYKQAWAKSMFNNCKGLNAQIFESSLLHTQGTPISQLGHEPWIQTLLVYGT